MVPGASGHCLCDRDERTRGKSVKSRDREKKKRTQKTRLGIKQRRETTGRGEQRNFQNQVAWIQTLPLPSPVTPASCSTLCGSVSAFLKQGALSVVLINREQVYGVN